jgi:hypothetical protein
VLLLTLSSLHDSAVFPVAVDDNVIIAAAVATTAATITVDLVVRLNLTTITVRIAVKAIDNDVITVVAVIAVPVTTVKGSHDGLSGCHHRPCALLVNLCDYRYGSHHNFCH